MTVLPNAGQAWRIAVSGLIALAAAMGIGRFVFTPLLPMMQEDAGLTITAGGWLAAANYLGYFAGALSAVWIRVPAGTMVRAGLVLNAVLLAAMGSSDGLTHWLAIRTLAGIVSAWVLVFGSAFVLRRLAQHGRVELSSVMFAGIGVGITLSGVMCIGFVTTGVGSRVAWLVFGAVSTGAALLAWPAFQENDSSVHADAHADPGTSRWTRAMMRLIAGYGLFGFAYIIPATFLPLFARDALGDARYYVWFWPACGIAAALSALVSVTVARRFGDRMLLRACYLAEAAGVALPAVSVHPASIAASAVLLGSTFVVITVTSLREARVLAPGRANWLIAAMTAAFALGQVAGPLAAAYLIDAHGSFARPLLLAAGVLLVSLALLPAATDKPTSSL